MKGSEHLLYMRGADHQQADMYSYLSPEQRVRADRPLRAVRTMADAALKKMSKRFDAMYATTGRPSIPPEKLLGAQLILPKNRNRLLEGDVAREFLSEVVKQAQAQGLTSDEHVTVDGTLIEAGQRQQEGRKEGAWNPPVQVL
jgi:transposase